MTSAEVWVNLVVKYGPFAILVFLVFVTERKIRAAIPPPPSGERKTFITIYILNWAAIFGLVVYSVYAWSWVNLVSEHTIKCKIEALPTSDDLTTSSEILFLRKVPRAGERSDYSLRLISPTRLSDGEEISFTLNPVRCEEGGENRITDYRLKIRQSFYEKGVLIQYEQETNRMFLVNPDGQREELPQSKVLINKQLLTARSEPRRAFLTPVAHAQERFSEAEAAASLQSPDAIVRRDARAVLARHGEAALPWIEKVLATQGSSYRLRLGVIVALNNMPNLRVESFKQPTTVAAIRIAATDPDEALRNEALQFLNKYNLTTAANTSAPVTVYEDINFQGRSHGFSLGRFRVDRGQFGNLLNDSASSLRVARGYKVRLCDNANGTRCTEFGEGAFQLDADWADRVSYVYVSKAPRR